MSRHILADRPNCQLVLGYDHMLRSFFGQRFNPSIARLDGIALGGWPTSSGLGRRRPVLSFPEATKDLAALQAWARSQQPATVWADQAAAQHLETLVTTLRREWDDGDDHADVPVPAVLQGELP